MVDGRLCIFGEVLFDHFPDGKRVLGGAPFNVAWHLQAFGQSPRFISRVGEDSEGDEIRTAMQAWGMDCTSLQTDSRRPTGKVTVSFEDGEPGYDIVEDCAYDAINAGALAASESNPECSLLYHGSLALRAETSRNALQHIKAAEPKTVFIDVNLRPPWWQAKHIQGLLKEAHWAKLNIDELVLLGQTTNNTALKPKQFLTEYELQGLIVTHGSEGAELLTAGGEHFEVSPARNNPVVDTVGAGDAFTSVMILGLANSWPLALTLQRAQDFASLLVGQRGATISDIAFYQPFIKDWQLETKT